LALPNRTGIFTLIGLDPRHSIFLAGDNRAEAGSDRSRPELAESPAGFRVPASAAGITSAGFRE